MHIKTLIPVYLLLSGSWKEMISADATEFWFVCAPYRYTRGTRAISIVTTS